MTDIAYRTSEQIDAIYGAIANVEIADIVEARDSLKKFAEKHYEEKAKAANPRWWWKAYSDYLKTDSWKTKRKLVIDRCGGLCEGCRLKAAIQVHHLSYAHVGHELLFELVGLCDDCHAVAHAENAGLS